MSTVDLDLDPTCRPESSACNVCFKVQEQTFSLGETKRVFHMLLADCHMMESYTKNLKACKQCLTTLKIISQLRDKIVQKLMNSYDVAEDAETKQGRKAKSCSVCFKQKSGLSSFELLRGLLNIFLQDTTIEIPKGSFSRMKCCDQCKTIFTHIAEFRDCLVQNVGSVIGNQVKEGVDSLPSSVEIKLEEYIINVENHEDNINVLDNEEVIRNPQLKDKTIDQDILDADFVDPEYQDIEDSKKTDLPDYQHTEDQDIEDTDYQDMEDPEYQVVDNPASEEKEIAGSTTYTENKEVVKKRRRNEKVNIPCEKCGKILKTRDSYNTHLRYMHSPSKQVKCHDCNKIFSHPQLLKYHQMYTLNHAAKTFKCLQCDKFFFKEIELDGHIEFVHEGRGEKCNLCGKILQPPYGLRKHMRNRHRNNNKVKRKKQGNKGVVNRQCQECGVVLKYTSSYNKHVKEYHSTNTETVFCEGCGKSFQTISLLKRHQENERRKKHKCDKCDRIFHSEKILEGHILYVHENKGHMCPICKRICPPPYGLIQHMKNAHHLPNVTNINTELKDKDS